MACAASLLAGCEAGPVDVDRGLPPPYDQLEVPAERLASEAAVRSGRALFLSYCAVCHGAQGRGDGPRAGVLANRPRDMTNPTWQRAMSPRRTYAAIHAGRPASGMPAWRALDKAQIWDLVAYVRTLGPPGSSQSPPPQSALPQGEAPGAPAAGGAP